MSVMAVPLVGIGSAIPILGETPYWQDGVAVLLVMVAIAAVLLLKRSPSSPSSESTP
jgi:drug/metabolite transporter (DMT)-like permease